MPTGDYQAQHRARSNSLYRGILMSISLPVVEPPIRVMAWHALLYCERLFYLEEVEEIRVADARVYAGRELHESLAVADEGESFETVEVASTSLGLFG